MPKEEGIYHSQGFSNFCQHLYVAVMENFHLHCCTIGIYHNQLFPIFVKSCYGNFAYTEYRAAEAILIGCFFKYQ